MPRAAQLPCYALTVPGLEIIAAEELAQSVGAEIRKRGSGYVVFRPERLDHKLLELRTVEDVFLLLWGTDALTYRAADLESITKWTAREPDWPAVLQAHHQIHAKPKGKPTYRLVTQMHGQHGYRRVDALMALARGMEGKLPSSWKPAEDNAAVEVWLTIHDRMALCGLRLSQATMRHRTYKVEHLPASLRPAVAAAMVRMAALDKGQWLVDPCCGAGTILAESLEVNDRVNVLGGDLEARAVRAAKSNLRPLGQAQLCRWDAGETPVRASSMDALATNPPFGKQLGTIDDLDELYARLAKEANRILRPGGRAVFLVADPRPLDDAARRHGWNKVAKYRLRLLGQPAHLCRWDKV